MIHALPCPLCFGGSRKEEILTGFCSVSLKETGAKLETLLRVQAKMGPICIFPGYFVCFLVFYVLPFSIFHVGQKEEMFNVFWPKQRDA